MRSKERRRRRRERECVYVREKEKEKSEEREKKKSRRDASTRQKKSCQGEKKEERKREERTNGHRRILGRTRTRAATNTLVRGPLLGKSSRLRLIPVVRKEAKETTRGYAGTRKPGTYKMKTRSEMIKLRIFLAYAGIKGGLGEMECPRLDGGEVRSSLFHIWTISPKYGQF